MFVRLVAIGLTLVVTALGQTKATAVPNASVVYPPPPGTGLKTSPGQPDVRSPEIAKDGKVTFRLYAPSAKKVALVGDWPGGIHNNTVVPMAQDRQGVWSVSVGPLAPEAWVYDFDVDGLATLDPKNPQVRRNGAALANWLFIPGGDATAYAVHDIPHGAVTDAWYTSTTMAMLTESDYISSDQAIHRRVKIYTPPGYSLSTKRYPVLYLLHGGGNDEEAWDDDGRLSQIMDYLIAQKKIVPMIVVMPNGNSAQTASQNYAGPAPSTLETLGPLPAGGGGRGGPETVIFPMSMVPDLLPFVDKAFRTLPDREHRAIAGLSMGGAQTFYAAFNNIDKFAWVGAFSPGFPLLPGAAVTIPAPQNWESLRGPDLTRSIDPKKFGDLLLQLNSKANLKLLYMSIGTADPLNSAFDVALSVVREHGLNPVVVRPQGYIHEWPVWRISLIDFLPRLFRDSQVELSRK
jgi:enterochelin esterase-like enzyme